MPTDTSGIRGYHAHIYYDSDSRATAGQLREQLSTLFDARLGRWHDKPVGPHPQAMYQVAFAPAAFSQIVPWLMLNRTGLNILVHPETGDDVADHTLHALWLGSRLALDIDFLRQPGAAG